MNRVILSGRLGADVEHKVVSPDQTVARMSLATTKKWSDSSGNSKEKTEWHKVIVWGKKADVCAKYLSKGSLILVEGFLQTRSWDDEHGNKRYTTEVVAIYVEFLDSKKSNNDDVVYPDIENDEIPF